jgi:RNA polymerase sigma-70 factor (ECF subfamily)
MSRSPQQNSFLDREQRWKTLFSQIQSGDQKAYRVLLEELMETLTRYYQNSFRKFGKSKDLSIDDLVQETLLAIHEKRSTYDSNVPFGPWLFAIARYKMIDFFRKNSREIMIDHWDTLEATLVSETFMAEVGSADDLENLLKVLPPRQQELLRLLKIEGLSVKEVATKLNLSESAVKVGVHRALKTLKKNSEQSLK